MPPKKISKEHQVPKLALGEVASIPPHAQKLKLTVEWISLHGLICDLDLAVLVYDERARFVEKLTADHPRSVDGSTALMGDIDSIMNENAHKEFSFVTLGQVSKTVTAVLFFVDGGPRNFQFVQSVIINCDMINGLDSNSFLSHSMASESVTPLFDVQGRTRRDCQGIALCILFKDFHVDGSYTWKIKNLLEHVYVGTLREKDEKCSQFIIHHVPSLEKYRPRLFQNIKTICNALSSKSLPLLKDKFAGPGLPIDAFVEVLFKQLFDVSPKLRDQAEADYLVAMLYDMFGQIDLNGDGSVDWDEFTSFTINTSVDDSKNSESNSDTETGFTDISTEGKTLSKTSQLDDYIIEYAEDPHFVDNSHFHGIQSVRHVPSAKRIILVPDSSDHAIIYDEAGKEICKFYPARAQASVIQAMDIKTGPHDHSSADPRHSLIVYDALYLTGRDLYAYCASDHTIGICKEKNSFGGKRIKYDMYNKIIFSNMLHLKLCWSQKANFLCSVASNNNIYGWDVDTGAPLFNVSRHTDVVTDFLALDDKELFATCSLDRRIVLWSMTSRRVKGILLGHNRGIRVLSVAKNTLLSAGFESDAKTWDLGLKEVSLTLQGHRHPILAAKIMCIENGIEDDLRAVTADESGELRLWNVYVKEKSSEAAMAPVLQVFQMMESQPPMNRFQAFVFPFSPNSTKGCYSNIFAFSSKLVHFTPEKSAREFAPSATTACNDSLGMVVTAVGRSLLKYDLVAGQFMSAFPNLNASDLTALCFDNEKGRKLYVGCNNGDVLMINFSTGAVINQVQAHTREVTCLYSEPGVPGTGHSTNTIVSGSLDGRLRVLEEVGGDLNIHYTTDNPFLDGSPVGHIKGFSLMKLMVVSSTGVSWTVWNITQHKRLMLVKEQSPILDVEIVTAPQFVQTEERRQEALAAAELSGEKVFDADRDVKFHAGHTAPKENLLTVAIAVATGINIYTLDILEYLAVRTFCLVHTSPIFITSLTQLHCSEENTINYSSGRNSDEVSKLGSFIIATADDGQVVCWDAEELLEKALNVYHKAYPIVNNDRGATHMKSLASFLDNIAYGKTTLSSNEFGDHLAKSDSFLIATPKAQSRYASQLNSALNSPRFHENEEKAKKAAMLRAQSEVEVKGMSDAERITSSLSWFAHFDAANKVIPLHNDGCILTVGHDGFHRVWNIDMECLGEMIMTNLTEEMKKKTKMTGYSNAWKYVQERIPITAQHRIVARKLLRQNLGHDRIDQEASGKRRSNLILPRALSLATKVIPMHAEKYSLGSRPNTSETSELREQKLLELSSPTFMAEDVSDFERPQSSVLTATTNDGASLSPDKGLNGTNLTTILSDNGSVFTGNSCSKARPKTSVWSPAQTKKKAMTPKAFSESSISLSHQTGLIDSESHSMLRKLGKDKGKASAYDRVVPELFVRDPKLSCGITVPKLEDVHVSEVHFGPQKALYKNAVHEYGARYSSHSNKLKTHHSVTTTKIQERIKNIGSMIHLENKIQVDDVIIPPDCFDDNQTSEEVLRRLPSKLGFNKETGITSTPASFGYLHRVGSVGAGGAAFTNNALKGIAMGPKGMMSIAESFVDQKDLTDDEPSYSTASDTYRRTSLQVLQSTYLSRSSKSLKSFPSTDSEELELKGALPTDSKLKLNKIVGYMDKLDSALDNDNIPEWERRSAARRLLMRHRKKLNALESTAVMKMQALEKRLAGAINLVFRIVGDRAADYAKSPTKLLTTRALLPFYKLEDVNHFLDVFHKVDTDFSGDLDPEEWTNFFTMMNRSVTHQEAQVMFLKMDVNEDGVLSIRELVPMVFNKASHKQLKHILFHVESEVMRKRHKDKDVFTNVDMEALFDFYDADVVGFVAISAIRERIALMNLPDAANEYIAKCMSGMEDDEMVNHAEFQRIFQPFLTKPRHAPKC